MSPALRLQIGALLVTVFGVLSGNGILTTLIPVRAHLEGFPDTVVGLMGSTYFFGMLAGAVVTPPLVARVRHVKGFALSSAMGALVLLALGLLVHPWSWVILRGLCGFFLAGIYAIVESYLQGRATNRIRGRLLGLYSVVQYAGWALGGQLMRLGPPDSFRLFAVPACLILVSILPLALVRDDAPAAPSGASAVARSGGMNLAWLFRVSPLGVVCVTLIGAANSSFWALTPVYSLAIGMSAVRTGTLMTAVMIGSALFQFPVGRLSDALDRRTVLVGLAGLTALCEVSLYLVGGRVVGWPLIVLGGVMGGLIATQYYTVSAHTNDRTGAASAVGVSAALLFLYCVGGMLGPLTASALMERFGAGALYLLNAGLHVAMVVFVLLRMRRSPPVRRREPAVVPAPAE